MRSDFWIACVAAFVMAVSPAWIVGNFVNPGSSRPIKFTALTHIPNLAIAAELPVLTRFAFSGATQFISSGASSQPVEFLAMLHDPSGIATLPLYSLQPAALRRDVADAIGLKQTDVRPAPPVLDDLHQISELPILSAYGAETLRQSLEEIELSRRNTGSALTDVASMASLPDQPAPSSVHDAALRVLPAEAPDTSTSELRDQAQALPWSSAAKQPSDLQLAAHSPAKIVGDARPSGASLLGAGTPDTADTAATSPAEPEVLPWLRPDTVKGRTRTVNGDDQVAADGLPALFNPRQPSDAKSRHRQRTARKPDSKPVRHSWRLASGIRTHHMSQIYATCGGKSVQCNGERTVCKC